MAKNFLEFARVDDTRTIKSSTAARRPSERTGTSRAIAAAKGTSNERLQTHQVETLFRNPDGLVAFRDLPIQKLRSAQQQEHQLINKIRAQQKRATINSRAKQGCSSGDRISTDAKNRSL